MLQYSCLENPSPWQRSLAGHIYSFSKSWTRPKWLCMHKYRTFFFFCLWQLCPGESWMWRWYTCLTCRDRGSAKCSGTQTASLAGVMALSPPYIPSICLSTVNSSPHTGIASQSLNSSSHLLPLPGDPCSCQAYVWLLQALCDSPSIWAATDQLFHSQP